MSQTKTLKAGQYLFNEGENAGAMYFVKKGCLSVRKKKGTGYVEISRVKEGEIVGEMSFFDRQPRSASAMALVPTELTEMNFEALDAIYAKVPDYLKTMMASIADRIRKNDDTIRRLTKDTVGAGEIPDDI